MERIRPFLEIIQVVNTETMICNIGVHVLVCSAVIPMFTSKIFRCVCARAHFIWLHTDTHRIHNKTVILGYPLFPWGPFAL